MESIPARSAFLIPALPIAWQAVRRPALCASWATASSSSIWNAVCVGSTPGVSTPPVAVAARHRDHPSGGLDRRSRDHATLDRLGQFDDDVVRRTTVANGGDAGAQRELGVEDSADGRNRNAVIADLLEKVSHAVVAEVDMAVDEPRLQLAVDAV